MVELGFEPGLQDLCVLRVFIDICTMVGRELDYLYLNPVKFLKALSFSGSPPLLCSVFVSRGKGGTNVGAHVPAPPFNSELSLYDSPENSWLSCYLTLCSFNFQPIILPVFYPVEMYLWQGILPSQEVGGWGGWVWREICLISLT